MITKDDLRVAFDVGASRSWRSFETWFHAYFTCRDCGKSTANEQIHRCLKETPFRGAR